MFFQNLAITAASVWSKAWPIIVAILFFGLIIGIHEFGHFITAKLFGVKVNQFSIGMGPSILKKQKGETLYALRLFPIGGYVSMEGEDEDSADERAFCNKKVWKKIIIVAAGAIMNLLLGLIFVSVLTCQSDLIATTQIHSFYDNAVSEQSGLQPGDIITHINGRRIFSDTDISYALARDTKDVMEYSFTKEGKQTPVVGKSYEFTVKRAGEKVNIENAVFETYEQEGRNMIIYDFILVGENKTVWNVITTTFRDSVSYARLVWLSLFDLVTGHFGINDISGPVGTVEIVADTISQAADETSAVDFSAILRIMALITINIGVFNLLPVPALDGGRLFFLIIEGIRRKPIPAKYEGMIHGIGLAVLLLFMLLITFKDIFYLFKG